MHRPSAKKSFQYLILGIAICSVFGNSARGFATPAIQDVSDSDDSYPAIKKSVDNGYLPVSKAGSFQPDKALSRKEMALILDRLTKKIDSSDTNLTNSDLQELLNLSRNFKKFLAENDSTIEQLKVKTDTLSDDQKTLNENLSKINESLKTEIQSLKQDSETWQQYAIWGGIGIGLLALFK
jgi:FtsZ-binding cell division protein ZapB